MLLSATLLTISRSCESGLVNAKKWVKLSIYHLRDKNLARKWVQKLTKDNVRLTFYLITFSKLGAQAPRLSLV